MIASQIPLFSGARAVSPIHYTPSRVGWTTVVLEAKAASVYKVVQCRPPHLSAFSHVCACMSRSSLAAIIERTGRPGTTAGSCAVVDARAPAMAAACCTTAPQPALWRPACASCSCCTSHNSRQHRRRRPCSASWDARGVHLPGVRQRELRPACAVAPPGALLPRPVVWARGVAGCRRGCGRHAHAAACSDRTRGCAAEQNCAPPVS